MGYVEHPGASGFLTATLEIRDGVDNESERALTRAIESLQRKKTLLIIAHRLTTVRRCDQLVFLKEGRVADVGAYDELEARNPDFRRMATPA